MTSDMITTADSGTWRLGDLTVNRLGYGAMRTLAKADGSPSDRDTVLAVLRRAIELGVNHIDTAAFYFSALRSANELINTALAPYPDDLVITTKVGPGRDAHGEWLPGARPEQLRGQVEENLRQLGRDHLDVVNLRLTSESGSGTLADRFGALAELREAGLVRHLGLSGVGAGHLTEALSIAPVVCVQNKFSLASDRADDSLVGLCAEHGVAFVPFFAIADGGSVSGAPGRRQPDERQQAAAEVAAQVAREHGVSPAQVRLAWTLHKGPNVLAIPGTGSLEHLAANVAAGALRLSADDLARLDTIG